MMQNSNHWRFRKSKCALWVLCSMWSIAVQYAICVAAFHLTCYTLPVPQAKSCLASARVCQGTINTRYTLQWVWKSFKLTTNRRKARCSSSCCARSDMWFAQRHANNEIVQTGMIAATTTVLMRFLPTPANRWSRGSGLLSSSGLLHKEAQSICRRLHLSFLSCTATAAALLALLLSGLLHQDGKCILPS